MPKKKYVEMFTIGHFSCPQCNHDKFNVGDEKPIMLICLKCNTVTKWKPRKKCKPCPKH